MKRPIENNSRAGDAVYDPFVGSGTTIIAAEMTGRDCLALEIDPLYVDVAIMRWQNFTGLKATLGGVSFDDVAAQRLELDPMGKGGRHPAPTHLKLLRGRPSHETATDRIEPQPEIPPGIPDAPDFLPPYGKDEWYRIAEELYYLKLLTRIDMQPLAAYCNAYATWRTAVETLAEIAARDPAMKGLLMKTTKGAMQSPLVMTARQSANDMVRYACEFGLTPAARTRINSADTFGPESKFGPHLVG